MGGMVPIPTGATIQGDPSTPPPVSSGNVPIPSGAQVVDSPEQANVSSVSAVKQPTTFVGKFGRWAENVANDIKYGTDETGIGTVLKRMGAHGVYAGEPEAVGDFMASLPLGLLKAGKGASEVTPEILGGPKGETVKGLKDVISGGLQASEMPLSFMAPEAAEATAEGAGAAADRVGEVAGEVANKTKKVGQEIAHGKDVAQPGAQDAIRRATGASDGEKIIEGGKSVMDDVVDRFDTMRRDLHAQASKKAGFDVQQAKSQLAGARERLKLTEGTESVDLADQAKQQISELEKKLSDASKTDPVLSRAANQANDKYSAAVQFRQTLAKATDVNGTVDVDKLLDAAKNLRFTKQGDRLQAFMGTRNADAFMEELEHMRDIGAHAMKVQKFAKWVAGIAGAGAVLEGTRAGIGALE